MKWNIKVKRGMIYEQRFAEGKSDCIVFGVVMRKAQIASAVPMKQRSERRQ